MKFQSDATMDSVEYKKLYGHPAKSTNTFGRAGYIPCSKDDDSPLSVFIELYPMEGLEDLGSTKRALIIQKEDALWLVQGILEVLEKKFGLEIASVLLEAGNWYSERCKAEKEAAKNRLEEAFGFEIGSDISKDDMKNALLKSLPPGKREVLAAGIEAMEKMIEGMRDDSRGDPEAVSDEDA